MNRTKGVSRAPKGVSAPKGARGAPRESPPQEGVSVPKGTRGGSKEEPLLQKS